MAKKKSETVGKTIRCEIEPTSARQLQRHYHLKIEGDFWSTDMIKFDTDSIRTLGVAFLEWCSDGEMLIDGSLTVEATLKGGG